MGAYIQSFLTLWTRGAVTQRMLKVGDSPGDSPGPHQDLALSAKVITGGPSTDRKAGCNLLWIDGPWGLLSRLHFLTSMLRSLR
jgi:hypothetical protein